MDATATRTAGTPPPAPDPSRTATVGPQAVLGRYRILQKLGSGGMADVWIGRATGEGAFERLVAIKTVHPDQRNDAAARAMFLREASLAATIRHANVVDVFDVGDEGGVLFQIMSLVEGESLAALIERAAAKLPFDFTAGVVGDALRGLHAAHESVDERGRPRQLIHRDVSPQNILVGLDGVARIADFGIAKAQAVHDETTGSLKGKVGYFAPEQAEQASLDRRTDVFAMGVVLWECLAGRRLFKGATMIETLRNVATMPIRPARDVNPAVPAPLSSVAERALERDPSRRFQTALEMSEALREACRLSAIAPSSERTSRVVDELVGKEVRERTRAALTLASIPPADLPAASGEEGAEARRDLPRRGERGRRVVVVAALSLAALLAVAALVFAGRSSEGDGERAEREPAPSAASAARAPAEGATSPPHAAEATPEASAQPPRKQRPVRHGAAAHSPATPSRTPPVSTNPFR